MNAKQSAELWNCPTKRSSQGLNAFSHLFLHLFFYISKLPMEQTFRRHSFLIWQVSGVAPQCWGWSKDRKQARGWSPKAAGRQKALPVFHVFSQTESNTLGLPGFHAGLGMGCGVWGGVGHATRTVT